MRNVSLFETRFVARPSATKEESSASDNSMDTVDCWFWWQCNCKTIDCGRYSIMPQSKLQSVEQAAQKFELHQPVWCLTSARSDICYAFYIICIDGKIPVGQWSYPVTACVRRVPMLVESPCFCHRASSLKWPPAKNYHKIGSVVSQRRAKKKK